MTTISSTQVLQPPTDRDSEIDTILACMTGTPYLKSLLRDLIAESIDEARFEGYADGWRDGRTELRGHAIDLLDPPTSTRVVCENHLPVAA